MIPTGVFSNGTLLLFLAMGALALLIIVILGGRARLDTRLEVLSSREGAEVDHSVKAQLTKQLSSVGKIMVPESEEKRTRLQARLLYAGLYHRQALLLFVAIKLLLMLSLPLLAAIPFVLHLLPMQTCLILGLALGIVGMIGPSFWLDNRKAERQTNLRRALPDALDILVICLEGGLSLPSALVRVSNELHSVHPLLASEFRIVQREVQLGRSAGEGLRNMGDRTGLEEVMSMASVIIQADKFGASLVRSLRVHADTLRLKRQQRAEELAQKAGTKILIPTILFIFPAIFVVILGPAAVQIQAMFENSNR